MAKHTVKIENEKEYNASMKKIDALMKKGESKLTNKEANELRMLSLAAQAFEKSIYTGVKPLNEEAFSLYSWVSKKSKSIFLASKL